MKHLALSLGTALLAAPLASAGSLSAPFTFDSAGMLPAGVRSVRVLGYTTEIERKWDGHGGYRALASGFNKAVNFQDLIEAEAEASDRAQLKGYLQAKSIGVTQEVGEAEGQVNARATATVPVLAYGLSERWTLAAIVPVVYTQVNVSTGWRSNSDFQTLLDGLSKEGQHAKKMSFQERLHNVVATKVAGYNYAPLADQQNQEIGDVSLGVKHLLHKDDDVAWVMAARVVAPTGRISDPNKVVDVAPGDGQWDVGVSTTAEWRISPRWSSIASAGYMHQMASEKSKRIPFRRNETLTPDVDTRVTEKLGDMLSSSAGVKYQPVDAWSIGLQYSLQYKGPDVYRGSAYEAERYEWMSTDTEQELQSAQAGVTYSTIPAFRAGQFLIPLETTLSLASTLGGRNTGKVDLLAWELALYF
ncbi:MAG TPA: transporter [Pseudobdellovibrionaceae bacterium]|nr:transporter [Pseudobdellovibrionaceae bacterium]